MPKFPVDAPRRKVVKALEILTVADRKQWRRFLKLPWKIYKGDPLWVPPLISDEKKLLDENKNPFYKHADVRLFLAKLGGEYVGRIMAIVNHNYNQFEQEKTGFFECVHDYRVAEGLLSAAKEWLQTQGMEIMRGPTLTS